MNFRKLIDNKELCEVYIENSNGFDVGIIFHENEDSIFVKSYDKQGKFSGYSMYPRDYVSFVAYKTKYIERLNITDLELEQELTFNQWNSREDVFEFLKSNTTFVTVDNYDNEEVACGIIVDYDEDSVTLQAYDEKHKEEDGFVVVNTDNFYVLNFGGNTKERVNDNIA
ncbi:MAG: hypothetical protein K2J16_06615 [Clostridia bacterium]|nr:hypothetical protein [Clostridia bacterium]